MRKTDFCGFSAIFRINLYHFAARIGAANLLIWTGAGLAELASPFSSLGFRASGRE
jgi:hypothetical protein